MPEVVMNALRGTLSELVWPLAAFEATAAKTEEEGGGGATVAIIFLLLLVVMGVVGYFWMQRRERMIQAYAEEDARMRSSIPEMQARIDQQVDLEVAAASAAAGSSFTATAATLPRASMPALDEPPPAPKMSLPGCGPVPGIPSANTGRASFAASASRRSVISSTISEYALGDDRPSVVASATSRTSISTPQVSEAAKRTSAAQRKSIADLAESRKSLVEVMKMYGPDEETTVEAATSRTSLSGWYAEDKKTGTSGGDAGTEKRESLSFWYNDGKQSQAAPPDPSKVVSMEQGKEGDVSVPSTVAHDLTEKDGTDGADQVEVSAPEAKAEA